MNRIKNPEPFATDTLQAGPQTIQQAVLLLQAGQVVAMPTETVYGLAGDALNPQALTRIFSAKERPTFDPLIVHVSPGLLRSTGKTDALDALAALDLIDLGRLSERAQARARSLIAAFWPGPLTLLFPKTARVPDLATSGLPRVGLRMPTHPVAQALIDAAKTPLAAPSANRFGRISPTRADHVASELSGRIPLILDGGACTVGVESTVLSLEPLSLLRPGGVSIHAIEKILGEPIPQRTDPTSALSREAQAAPGMLASHYAPRKPLALLGSTQAIEKLPPDPEAGLLVWERESASELAPRFGLVLGLTGQGLSPEAQTEEAARALFEKMRELDDCPSVRHLLAQPCPTETGLGLAIQDRLKRASVKL